MARGKNMKVLEHIDSRILGALRCVDHATEATIRTPLKVVADNVRFIRNLSSYYVISHAPGLEEHITEFEAPPMIPPLDSIEITVSVEDPGGTYLPRTDTITVPRDPDPEATHSVFQPVDVILYRTSNASVQVNWSIVRGSVFQLDEESARISIRGALLRVIRTEDDAVLARGLSDTRGEFLITVPGIPITSFANGEDDGEETPSGPVVTSETPVCLEVIVDPALPWPVNPDELEAHRASWVRNADEPLLLSLKTGHMEKVEITVDLTDGS
jgi:hypothetical protein